MTALVEGDLRLELPGDVGGKRFDDHQHGLSHCMKVIDWIVDLGNHVCFIEVKDPDHPAAKAHDDREKFLQDLSAGNFTRSLVTKFRDSFLCEWACDRIDKPVNYYVIVASSSLDSAQLLTRADELKRELPAGTPGSWSRPIANDCIVFNLEKWNKIFPQYRLSRCSDVDE